MANITQVEVNGTTYDICDAVARDSINPVTGAVTPDAAWSTNVNSLVKIGNLVVINLHFLYDTVWGSVAKIKMGTVPAGFRPSADTYLYSCCQDANQVRGVATYEIKTDGTISVFPDSRVTSWRWVNLSAVYVL